MHARVAQQLIEFQANGFLPSSMDIKQLNREWEANFSTEVCFSLPLVVTRVQNLIFRTNPAHVSHPVTHQDIFTLMTENHLKNLVQRNAHDPG